MRSSAELLTFSRLTDTLAVPTIVSPESESTPDEEGETETLVKVPSKYKTAPVKSLKQRTVQKSARKRKKVVKDEVKGKVF